MIEEYNLQDKVKLLGFKSGQELKDIVANSFCVCLPSEWYENGPYSIMEAQAAGKPVIVSGNGGLPELVEDSVTGCIVKPKNVKELAQTMQLCEKNQDWNQKYIVKRAQQKYAPEQYVEYLQRIYSNLLKNKTRNYNG